MESVFASFEKKTSDINNNQAKIPSEVVKGQWPQEMGSESLKTWLMLTLAVSLSGGLTLPFWRCVGVIDSLEPRLIYYKLLEQKLFLKCLAL